MEELKDLTIGIYIEDEAYTFDVGDVVQVKQPSPEMEDTMAPEDYYYLLSFGKKKGVITDIKIGKVINIYVDFGGEIGIFYEQDLKKIA